VDIRNLIRQLGKDRTVILSTHIMQEVREMCDRVLVLSQGCIQADQAIEDVTDLETLFREKTAQ
jgi:ABC-2 type transport system ATP-binding protein